MYDFEVAIGEPIVFLEIAPTKELTRRGASFSLAREHLAVVAPPYAREADGKH